MPNFFNKYPYTDFHELNLDWILETVKTVAAEWAATLEEWHNTQEEWQQLYDYVHDFFDNLDVQQEVDNKINEMITDGTFENIVTPIINARLDTDIPAAVTSWLDDNVTPVGSAVVVDSTLTIPGAAADAKATGDAVQNIYKRAADQVNFMSGNSTLTIEGEYVNTSGMIVSDAAATRTEYVPVIPGTYIDVTAKIASIAFGLAFFDKDLQCITSESIAGTNALQDLHVQVPDSAFYAVASGYNFHGPSVITDDVRSNELELYRAMLGSRYIYYGTPTNIATFISASTLNIIADANSYCSPVIAVAPGETITYSTFFGSAGLELALFNRYGVPVINASIAGRSDTSENVITVPADIYFARLYAYAPGQGAAYIKIGAAPSSPEVPADGFYTTSNTGGYYRDGSLITDGNGQYSDPIPVHPGSVIEFELVLSGAGDYLTLLNADMQYISKVVGGTANRKRVLYTVTDPTCAYIIASSYQYDGTITAYDSIDTYEFMHRNDVFAGGFDCFSIFRKFCVIGDSLSVGTINYPDSTVTNRELEYSWGAYIARKYGSTCVHCGFSGATAESWLTNPLGLAALQDPDSLSQCYIIALGANELPADIGSPATVNDPTTFYGAYKAIYDAIRTENATAIVFMTTLPTRWGDYEDVNTAVRWLAANVGDGNTFILDLWTNYQKYYYSQPVSKQKNIHYYPAGYQLMSKIIEHALDSIILDNPAVFAYVPKITYS